MIITKEIMLHMAIGGSVTGAIFAVLFSSGAVVLDDLEIMVFADAKIIPNYVFLSYMIQNTGDYNIKKITVTLPCCDYSKTLELEKKMIHIQESEEFHDIIPISGISPGDKIVVQFDAYDGTVHHDVTIMTVLLE